ncbi:MAG: carbon-nitrogen hydrolase family protein [Treponemataceae bacterium]
MKISLCAELSTLNIKKNLDTIKRVVETSKSDLFVFGEAFLQGFDAMSFEYKKDIKIALPENSIEIAQVKNLAKENECAIAFGFYENASGTIFTSCLVVGKTGKTLCKYRRVSTGWRIQNACADYREGENFQNFELDGKRFGILLCGDFWEDKLLPAIADLDAEVDAFLWAVHCDYTIERWEKDEHPEYKKRTTILAKPVFFCNNYTEDELSAKGGAYLWQQGKEIKALKAGKSGVLTFEF